MSFSRQSTNDEIASAGVKALLILYGGLPDDTLDELRYTRFREKVASRSSADCSTDKCFSTYHSFIELPTTTVLVFIGKFNNGWSDLNPILNPKNQGSRVALNLSGQTYHKLQMPF
jgi:hypothetical protein